MKKRIALLLLLALLPAFASCGGSTDDDHMKAQQQDQEKEKQKEEAAATAAKKKGGLPICPQVAIVRDLATFRDYGQEKPDRSQVIAASRMDKIEGDCAYPDDGGIDVEFDLHFIAQRGPRLGGNRDGFPYFIAIVDPDGNVIDKNQLTIKFKFSSDIAKIEDKTESLHVFIPLAQDERKQGPYYRVLTGFQLTEDQFNAIQAAAKARMDLPEPVPKPDDAPSPGSFSESEKKSDPFVPGSADTKDAAPYPEAQHFLRLPPNYKPAPGDAPTPADASAPPDTPSPLDPSLSKTPTDVTPPVGSSPSDTPTTSAPTAGAPTGGDPLGITPGGGN